MQIKVRSRRSTIVKNIINSQGPKYKLSQNHFCGNLDTFYGQKNTEWISFNNTDFLYNRISIDITDLLSWIQNFFLYCIFIESQMYGESNTMDKYRIEKGLVRVRNPYIVWFSVYICTQIRPSCHVLPHQI